jgi:hypothetical protein
VKKRKSDPLATMDWVIVWLPLCQEWEPLCQEWASFRLAVLEGLFL